MILSQLSRKDGEKFCEKLNDIAEEYYKQKKLVKEKN